MGKASTMDVTGEGLLTHESSLSIRCAPTINFLLPFLVFVQVNIYLFLFVFFLKKNNFSYFKFIMDILY